MRSRQPARRWWLVLFGLPFLSIGLGSALLGPLDTLRLHLVSDSWARVPAQLTELELVSARGDKSTTYRVHAAYDYTYAGRSYRGSRVGYDTSADSMYSDHARLERYLRRHLEAGRPVLAWVDPERPGQTLLVRELRPKKLLFTGVFGLVFALVGAGVIALGLHHPEAASRTGGPIYSAERYAHWLWWGMGALFWLLPLPGLLELPAALRADRAEVLLILVFPLAGSWLLRLGWRGFRQWRHYGPLPVIVDPQPGQLGGDVGSRIRLRRPPLATTAYRFTLQCLHSRTRGSGKDRRRSETLVWQQEQDAYVSGNELQFVFQPPAELPASGEPAADYHLWRLLLSGPTEPVLLERTYTIPVARGAGRSGLSFPAGHQHAQAQREQERVLAQARRQIQVVEAMGGLQIHSPFGSHLGMKLVVVLFGVIFAGAAAFLSHQATREGGMLWLMAVVFSLFGYPMLLAGLFIAGRSLRAEIRNGVLRTTRYWCGIPLRRRQLVLTPSTEITLGAGVKSSDGRRHTEYLHLIVADRGGKFRVAEDIAGRAAAEALREQLIKRLGLAPTPLTPSARRRPRPVEQAF